MDKVQVAVGNRKKERKKGVVWVVWVVVGLCGLVGVLDYDTTVMHVARYVSIEGARAVIM